MKYFFLAILIGLSSQMLFGQNSLYGNVYDNLGNPLPGATVILENSKIGTSTDADGFYMFNKLEAQQYNLQVNYIGFEELKKVVDVKGASTLDFTLKEVGYDLEPVVVLATWATEKTPVTYTNIGEEELGKSNQGQDIPFLVRWTPSVVATSDAGAGVGYTGLRIRGSDPTQTNVTINGIPLNDSESQGVFWVNLPDLASSTENIQIQRGVGTSTNGAGAFGATINVQTSGLEARPYVEFDNTFGSFNTHKHTLKFGSGKLKNNLAFDARLSLIQSDGYVDRASSDLRGMYLSGGYFGDKTTLRAVAIIGAERTYQSWYGTPQGRIENDQTEMERHASFEGYSDAQLDNLLNSGRTYNFYLYENEVDDYKQDHYQLHLNHQLNTEWSLGAALHYTYGRGFFEQYKDGEDFEFYQIRSAMIDGDNAVEGDVIRRRWLDNDFYGVTYNLKYQNESFDFVLGGAANQYDGDHFGQAIKVITDREIEVANPVNYYFSVGNKRDINVFAKANYQINSQLNLFADLQVRNINYSSVGTDNDLVAIDFDESYTFFNPKLGLNYSLDKFNTVYASFSVGQKEPLRSDFTDAPTGTTPEAEKLSDLEIGYKLQTSKADVQINLYNMDYSNQLVQTGELNDVGAVLRTNVADSYRRGVEVQWALRPNEKFTWSANFTLSQNKIKSFDQIVYDYTNGFDVLVNNFEDTDISFSPKLIAANVLSYEFVKGLNIGLRTKYVSEQFLDNTQNDAKKIDSYFVNDVVGSYDFNIKGIRSLGLRFSVHNVFDVLYSANGYTYSYVFGDPVTENFFYPQAGIHFMVGLKVGL